MMAAMSIGGIVIPLVALAVCGGAMWLAWRIVKFADAESADAQPLVDTEEAATPRSSKTRKVGIAVAVLAMAVGLGGIALVVWRALGG